MFKNDGVFKWWGRREKRGEEGRGGSGLDWNGGKWGVVFGRG